MEEKWYYFSKFYKIKNFHKWYLLQMTAISNYTKNNHFTIFEIFYHYSPYHKNFDGLPSCEPYNFYYKILIFWL